MNTNTIRYAGFWPRLASALLDLILLLPIVVFSFWGLSTFRWFELYSFLPSTVFGLFFHVYLVRRYGGTPGKLIVGIRIRKLNGEPVGYREAFLRYSVDFILGMVISVALIFPLFRMTDAEYHSLSFMQLSGRLADLAPSWYKPSQWIQTAWVWGELIVLLTNRKRRALHDFMAGTVVVHVTPLTTTSAEPTGTAPETATGA